MNEMACACGLVGALVLGACSSGASNNNTRGSVYLKRACVDFNIAVQGSQDGTMTKADEVAELDKMIVQSQTAEDVNSGWHTFNLSAKQLRVAVVNDDTSTGQRNVSFFHTICDALQSN